MAKTIRTHAVLVAFLCAAAGGCAATDSIEPGGAGDGTSALTAQAFGLHVIWLKGEGEANAPELDSFLDALIGHTNLLDYWKGAATAVRRSTSIVTAPSSIPSCGSPCYPENMGPWISSLVAAGKVPAPAAGEVPIYEVLIDHKVTTHTVLSQGAGGTNGVGTVSGKRSGLFMVGTRTNLFWPGRTPLADETIATEHELAENINLLLGRAHGGLIGDGVCEFPTCSPDRAEGIGPTAFLTGDGCGRHVTGWLVQPLATASDSWSGNAPTTCSFHVVNVSAPPPPPPPPPADGCAANAGMYMARSDGKLLWYGNENPGAGSSHWAAPEAEAIGTGWSEGSFDQFFDGGSGVIYAIRTDGALLWYRYSDPFGGHGSFVSGSGAQIGHGWSGFTRVVGGGDGVMYALTSSGDLLWYRHTDPIGGTAKWATGSGGKVGSGWGGFANIVAGGHGILYATKSNGDLLWYRHADPTGGSWSWAPGSGSKIGSGFTFDLRSAGQGVLYGWAPSGLTWYRHTDPMGGSASFANGGHGLVVGSGWDAFDVRLVDVQSCP